LEEGIVSVDFKEVLAIEHFRLVTVNGLQLLLINSLSVHVLLAVPQSRCLTELLGKIIQWSYIVFELVQHAVRSEPARALP